MMTNNTKKTSRMRSAERSGGGRNARDKRAEHDDDDISCAGGNRENEGRYEQGRQLLQPLLPSFLPAILQLHGGGGKRNDQGLSQVCARNNNSSKGKRSPLPPQRNGAANDTKFLHAILPPRMDTTNATGEEEREAKTVKLVIQQCLSARLKPPPPSQNKQQEDFGDRSIRAGMVVFVCFSKGADEGAAIRAAEAAARLRLCEPEVEQGESGGATRGKRTSVLERRGDVLVVPQFTLGAKLKGRNNSLQYHGNVDKADGERLFAAFCAALAALVREEGGGEARVVGGAYGARQRLAMDTDGPFTHTLQL